VTWLLPENLEPHVQASLDDKVTDRIVDTFAEAECVLNETTIFHASRTGFIFRAISFSI
jgi:hypothetical protein